MPKIFDHKGKRELIVSVKRDPSAEPGVVDDRTGKGMMPGSRKPGGVFRRRKQGGIEFWDMAMVLVGENYELIDYHLPAVLSDFGTAVGLNQPALSDFTAMADKIFEIPVEQWSEKYRKLSYEMLRNAVLYRLRVQSSGGGGLSSESDLFTPSGLKLTDAILNGNNFFYANQTGQITGAFHNDIQLTGTFKRKITTVRNYASSAVAFTPGKKDKVFLMPIMAAPSSQWTANTPTSLQERWADAWRPVPRDPYVEPSSPHYNAPLASVDYATAHSNLDRFRSFELDPQGGRNTNGTFTTIPAASIPDPTYWPVSGPSPQAFNYFTTWQTVSLPAGVLVAVIEQGGVFYYVWAN